MRASAEIQRTYDFATDSRVKEPWCRMAALPTGSFLLRMSELRLGGTPPYLQRACSPNILLTPSAYRYEAYDCRTRGLLFYSADVPHLRGPAQFGKPVNAAPVMDIGLLLSTVCKKTPYTILVNKRASFRL